MATSGGLLTVPRAGRKHAGRYECHASNGVGQICPFRIFIAPASQRATAYDSYANSRRGQFIHWSTRERCCCCKSSPIIAHFGRCCVQCASMPSSFPDSPPFVFVFAKLFGVAVLKIFNRVQVTPKFPKVDHFTKDKRCFFWRNLWCFFVFFTAGDGVMVGVQLVIQCKLSKIILQLLLYLGCSVFRCFLFSVSILIFAHWRVCCVKLILCSVALLLKVF